ncbi:MAG: cellulase family glycosylhydrolase [Capsulimonadaceae bacterium]
MQRQFPAGAPALLYRMCAAGLLMALSVMIASADPATVHVDNSLGFPRLLTEHGTPIRAMSLSWDAGEPTANLPTQDQINSLASDYGVNAVRVFLECHKNHVGVNATICDQLVDECGKAGLYVILTIGGCEPGWDVNTQRDSEWDYARQFWTFYAPRYASRTHVIYELHNEPGPWVTGTWSQRDYDFQMMLYNTVRQYAPSNHIMLFCWPTFDNAATIQRAVDYVSAHGVDWHNASISFHGYGTQAAKMRKPIDDFLFRPGNQAALTCTEFIAAKTAARDPDTASNYTRMLEQEMIGWCRFDWLTADDADLTAYKADCNSHDIAWMPDSGDWPDTDGLPIERIVEFTSAMNGLVLSVAPAPGFGLSAVLVPKGQACTPDELFEVVDIGNGSVALRSMLNKKYVTVDADTGLASAASVDPGPAETFFWTWSNRSAKTIFLEAANGKTLSAGKPGLVAADGLTGHTFQFSIYQPPADQK